MIHFLYLVAFALFVSICFAVFSSGTSRDRMWYGLKTFLQFLGISLLIAWVLYFIPF
jgi:hypothetical protein